MCVGISVDVSVDVLWIWNVRTWTNDSVVVHSVYFKRTRKQEQIIKAIHAYVLVFFVVIVFTCLKPKRRQTKTMTAMATKLTYAHTNVYTWLKGNQSKILGKSIRFNFSCFFLKKILDSGFLSHTIPFFRFNKSFLSNSKWFPIRWFLS